MSSVDNGLTDHTTSILTKATATSIASAGSGGVIVQYGNLTEHIRVILTDFAIPISVVLSIALFLLNVWEKWDAHRFRIKEENRKELLFETELEERRHGDLPDLGVRRRKND